MAEDNIALEAETADAQTEVEITENQDENPESVAPELSAESGAGAEGETPNAEAADTEAVADIEAAADAEAVADETPAASTPSPDAEGFTSALPSLASEMDRKHVAGGVGYEIIYVVKAGDPQLVETSSQRVRELIEQTDGAVDNVRASEVRRFAYPIQKQNEGVYVVVNARFKPQYTGELDRYFKIDESILRHMMLKEDR